MRVLRPLLTTHNVYHTIVHDMRFCKPGAIPFTLTPLSMYFLANAFVIELTDALDI